MKTELNFKVDDIVKVMPFRWYDFFKNKSGSVFPNDVGIANGRYYFSKEMTKKCGVFLDIIEVVDNWYKVRGMNEIFENWMFESKAVTEEKQEVEQSNKNNMETKKMTLRRSTRIL